MNSLCSYEISLDESTYCSLEYTDNLTNEFEEQGDDDMKQELMNMGASLENDLRLLTSDYYENNQINPKAYQNQAIKLGLRNADGSGVVAGFHGDVLDDCHNDFSKWFYGKERVKSLTLDRGFQRVKPVSHCKYLLYP